MMGQAPSLFFLVAGLLGGGEKNVPTQGRARVAPTMRLFEYASLACVCLRIFGACGYLPHADRASFFFCLFFLLAVCMARAVATGVADCQEQGKRRQKTGERKKRGDDAIARAPMPHDPSCARKGEKRGPWDLAAKDGTREKEEKKMAEQRPHVRARSRGVVCQAARRPVTARAARQGGKDNRIGATRLPAPCRCARVTLAVGSGKKKSRPPGRKSRTQTRARAPPASPSATSAKKKRASLSARPVRLPLLPFFCLFPFIAFSSACAVRAHTRARAHTTTTTGATRQSPSCPPASSLARRTKPQSRVPDR